MQAELEAAYPTLEIQMLGVNSNGQEVDFASAVGDDTIPLLQDTDTDEDGLSDAWTLWDAEWRDVVILDGVSQKKAVYNLTDNDLADQENYAALRAQILHVARNDQRPWSNFNNLLDVNGDGTVTYDDAQLVVDSLNQEGARSLPAPQGGNWYMGEPYYDCNMDGLLSPLDALLVLNEVNGFNGGEPAGEGESGQEGPLSLAHLDSGEGRAGIVTSAAPELLADSVVSDFSSFSSDQVTARILEDAVDEGERDERPSITSHESLPLLDPLLVDLLFAGRVAGG